MYQNSQKRIYRAFGIYFITSNVSTGLNYLGEDIFGHLLENLIHISATINDCSVIAYKINPDHIHLLIQTGEMIGISTFMGTLKRNFTRYANFILSQREVLNKCDDSHHRTKDIKNLWAQFEVYSQHKLKPLPAPELIVLTDLYHSYCHFMNGKRFDHNQFLWQKSFHFHLITSSRDLENHVTYILQQSKKHGLKKNSFCFLSENLTDGWERFSQMQKATK